MSRLAERVRILLTEHAREKLALLGLSREDIEWSIDHADGPPTVGETAVEYDATISATRVHIVVVHEAEPARLITVYAL